MKKSPGSFLSRILNKRLHWHVLLVLMITLVFMVTPAVCDDQTENKKGEMTVEEQEKEKEKKSQEYDLQDIVVTDRLFKGFEETLHEQPATIHSISSEEIENMDVKRTLDLIRRIPGVTAEDYNQQGVAAAYSFRGFRAGHGIGAASYLDGIPYNEINHVDGDGYPDYNTILPESIDRLEVIKGLSSPVYGGYAQAGVLHYITKDKGDYTKAKLTTGSWNYYRGVAQVAREYEKFFTYNAVSAEQGDGYRDHSDWNGGNVFSRLGYRIDDLSTIRLTLHSYKTVWNAPGPLTTAQWEADDLKTATTDGGGNKTKNMVSLDYSRSLTDTQSLSLIGYGYNSDFTRWVGAANEERHDERNTFGSRAMYDISADIGGLKNDFLLGIDYENINSQQQKYNIASPTNRIRASVKQSYDFDFNSTAFYFQENFWPASFLKLAFGSRFELFEGDMTDNKTGQSYSLSENVFCPKGGILITPFDGLEFFSNVGTGFVLPSTSLKFTNSNLDPSELISYDLGVRYLPVPEMLLQVSLFRTDTTDEVITDPITLVETNAGETRRQGIEAGAEWYVIPDLTIYVNGVYQDAEYMEYNTSGGNYRGNDINRVPEWIARAGVEYFPKLGFGGSFTAKYTGERWSDAANTRREPDFLVFDASLQYAFEKITFTLFANNLFDKKYAELQSANSYSPSDPFNISLSASITF